MKYNERSYLPDINTALPASSSNLYVMSLLSSVIVAQLSAFALLSRIKPDDIIELLQATMDESQ